jgi:outer membrane protein assembly factor BamD
MKGLVNFRRGDTNIVNQLFPNDPAKTDTSLVRQSYNDFTELVRKFPNSQYADDARKRVLYLHNSLATHEIHVANYYMQRGAYVAAVNRAEYVLQNYARTPSVPAALAIMIKAYTKLGLPALAADNLRVLKLNYPDSPDLPELTALVNGTEYHKPFSLSDLSF